MTLTETLSTFLTTYSVGRDSVTRIAQLSDDTWQVDYDNGPSILIRLDEAAGRLALQSVLGRVPAERKLPVYEALLVYSVLWRETGGVRGALNAEGEAMLLVDLILANVSESLLHRALDNFSVKTRYFAAHVAAGAPADEADTSSFIRL
jgi:hypothetical protein